MYVHNAGREYGIKTGETLHKHLQWATKIATLILRLLLEQLFRFYRALRRQRERNRAQHCQSNHLKEAHREQGRSRQHSAGGTRLHAVLRRVNLFLAYPSTHCSTNLSFF